MVFVDVTHAKKKTNGSFVTARPFARASSSAPRPRVHKGGGENSSTNLGVARMEWIDTGGVDTSHDWSILGLGCSRLMIHDSGHESGPCLISEILTRSHTERVCFITIVGHHEQSQSPHKSTQVRRFY